MSETTLKELIATAKEIERVLETTTDDGERAEAQRLLDKLEVEIEAKVRENAGDSYGGWGSAGMGAIDGLTLGFADEAGGSASGVVW